MKYLTGSLILFLIILPLSGGKIDKYADLILIKGKVLTMDKGLKITEAVAIKNNKILQTGKNNELLKLKGERTKVISLKGKTIIPGLHDAHLHFESGANLILNRIDLRFLNKEEILKKIEESVKISPEGALIRAYSYNQTYFKDKKWPDRYDLDKVSPENPVIVTRVDGHSIWVNSKALEMAGITRDTKDPQGGELLRFKDNSPTGILKENAEMLVNKINGPKMVVPGARGKDHILNAIKYANKLGLTSVTTSGGIKLIEHLKTLEKKGLLSLRFNVWITPEEMDNLINKGIGFNEGSDKIKISFVKLFSDGSVGSASAAFFKPYLHRPDSRGILIQPVPELENIIKKIHKNNWQVGVHAIGNRAVHIVLDSVEKAQKLYGVKGLRHRIEHTQFIIDNDLNRFNNLQMVPSMQPTHCTSDLLVVEERVGKDRARQGYRWNSFKKKGTLLAFGTDWPVEPLDPRRGLYSSVERKNIESNIPEGEWFPEERISITDAIKYYTYGSAYASFNEKRLGSIEKGKLADLTIYDGDLMELSNQNKRGLLKVPVFMTIMDGRIIFSIK
ncbi:MAG: amidohydrolase [Acidobacteriota bacterium]